MTKIVVMFAKMWLPTVVERLVSTTLTGSHRQTVSAVRQQVAH